MKELWCEKYRPKKLADYVFKDEHLKKQMLDWVAAGSIGHLLFSGGPGTGKTTCALALLNELGVDPGDIKMINASVNNGVDYIRDTVIGFASTMPFGEFKCIILDESDYISPAAQAALRGVMERYASSVRFILTCNYLNKIIPAIQSRCQGVHIESLDKVEFTVRLATILSTEEVEFDLDTLDTFVNATYPDMRKCINTVQMHSSSGKLVLAEKVDATQDYKLEMVALFKTGKIKEARNLICKQIQDNEYEDMYRFLYDNLQFFGDTEQAQDEAVLIIAKGLVNHTSVADPEINLSATLIQLSRIDG